MEGRWEVGGRLAGADAEARRPEPFLAPRWIPAGRYLIPRASDMASSCALAMSTSHGRG